MSIASFFRYRKQRSLLLGHDAEARSKAAEKLANLGWQSNNDTEKAALLVGQWKLEEAAALGSVATRFLGEAMVKANPRTRVKIAGILGNTGDHKAVSYLLKTIKEGDCWVTIHGEFLATEASRGMTNRMAGLFPGLGGIGGMIDMGGARVEVRKVCEDALVSIAKRGVDLLPALIHAKASGVSWVSESVKNVLNQIGKGS